MEDAQIGSVLMAQPFYMGLEKLLQKVPLTYSVITNFFPDENIKSNLV